MTLIQASTCLHLLACQLMVHLLPRPATWCSVCASIGRQASPQPAATLLGWLLHALTYCSKAILQTRTLSQAADTCTQHTLHTLLSMQGAWQVSTLWCFYNTSAPFLLLWHKLFHNRGLTLLVNFWAMASSLIVLAIICIIWVILPTEYEYGQVCPAAVLLGSRDMSVQYRKVLPAVICIIRVMLPTKCKSIRVWLSAVCLLCSLRSCHCCWNMFMHRSAD